LGINSPSDPSRDPTASSIGGKDAKGTAGRTTGRTRGRRRKMTRRARAPRQISLKAPGQRGFHNAHPATRSNIRWSRRGGKPYSALVHHPEIKGCHTTTESSSGFGDTAGWTVHYCAAAPPVIIRRPKRREIVRRPAIYSPVPANNENIRVPTLHVARRAAPPRERCDMIVAHRRREFIKNARQFRDAGRDRSFPQRSDGPSRRRFPSLSGAERSREDSVT